MWNRASRVWSAVPLLQRPRRVGHKKSLQAATGKVTCDLCDGSAGEGEADAPLGRADESL